MAGLVDSFHRHAAGERSVADQSDDMMVFAFSIARKMGRCVSRAEGFVFRFVPTQETADTAVLFYRWEQLAPSGENLVRVGLMAYVPNQSIAWCIERVVQSDRQLNRAQ